MFKKKSRTARITENVNAIKQNVKGLEYIQDVLQNVYNITTYNEELDTIIEDIKYVNPSTSEKASTCHEEIDIHVESIKRLFDKYSLELNEYDFKKLLKKVKLKVYERKKVV